MNTATAWERHLEARHLEDQERHRQDQAVIGRQAAQLQAQAATITAVRNALTDNTCPDCGCLHAAIQDALDSP